MGSTDSSAGELLDEAPSTSSEKETELLAQEEEESPVKQTNQSSVGDDGDSEAKPENDDEEESASPVGAQEDGFYRKKDKQRVEKPLRNELTKHAPGYVAPMKLETATSQRIRQPGGLASLYQKAQVEDATKSHQRAKFMSQQTTKYGGFTAAYQATHASMKTTKKQQQKAARRARSGDFGQGWFHMKPTRMTDEMKQDMLLIRNRNYLDPKKFYKSTDGVAKTGGSMVQVGTVVEGAAEFFSSRLTKKERRRNLVDEIMADPASSDYAKRKFRQKTSERDAKRQRFQKENPKARPRDFRALK